MNQEQRLLENLKCSAGGPGNLNGFRYWLATYAVIEDQAVGGPGPFQLWPCHLEAIDALEQDKYLIVLKARQIGMSWLYGAAYPLWLANFHKQKLALLFSQRDDESAELIRKARYMWAQLPPWMQAPLEKDNQFALTFANGSRILAMPSSPNAGSGYTANYAFADEHAKQEHASEQFQAIKPTVDSTPGARFVSNSTAYGTGNFYHELWTGAKRGENGFRPLFFGWQSRPDRDPAWYASTKRTFPNPVKFVQEYPTDPDEAFMSSVPRRLATDLVAAAHAPADPLAVTMHRALQPLLALRRTPRGLGFVLYREPERSAHYVIGADIAEGDVVSGDASCAVVVDRDSGEEVACLHGRWPLPQFTGYLHQLAAAYHAQPLAVERNNHGHYVNLTLEQLRIDRQRAGETAQYALFYEKPTLTPQGVLAKPGKAGFYTDARSKQLLFDNLEEGLMGEHLTLHTPALVEELKYLQVFDDGKIGAPPKAHDDLAVALAITWMAVLQTPAARARPQVPFVMGRPEGAPPADSLLARLFGRPPQSARPAAPARRAPLLQRLNRRPVRAA